MRLLILGTGLMANAHAKAFAKLSGVTLAGCVDVNAERAAAFAKEHSIPQTFTSLDAALATGGFDAMANVTPDSAHYATTLQALKSGLHVFCEKPLATDAIHAEEMASTAKVAGVVHGVNLTYRNVAALHEARRIVEEGEIGSVRHFEASYLQSWLTQPAWGDWKTEDTWLWRLSTEHGSTGVLGDVGIHIMDFLTYAANEDISHLAADLTTFPKAPDNRIGEYKLDANDSVTIIARLTGGASGVIHASRFASGHLNDLSVRLYGDKGGLKLTNSGDFGTLEVCLGADLETATWREVTPEPVITNFQRFAEAVASGAQMRPDFDTGAKLQRLIDAAFDAESVEPSLVR